MSSIKKNFSYNLLLNLSSVFFPFVTAPYVARVLGPEPCGLAGFATTYAGYFAMFAALGAGNYGMRQISKLRDDKKGTEVFLSEMLSLTLFQTIFVSIVYLCTLFMIPMMRDHLLIYFIAGFSIYLLPLAGLNWYFTGNERFDFITIRSLIIRILSIIALFIFVKKQSDLYIYMILNVISTFGIIFSNIYKIRKEDIHIRITTKGLKKHYGPMLLLFSSTIAISIYTMLDSLMLGLMSSYSEVAFYRNATTLCKALLSVATSLSAVAVPRIAYYFKDNDYEKINSLVAKSLSIISFLAIPMTIGIICIAPVFVPLFLGEQYIPAIHPTMIMSGVVVAIGFNNLTGIQILIGMGKDKLFLWSVLTGTFSNFILNFIFIPWWGASGAAASSVIAESLILITQIYFIKKHTKVEFGTGIKDIWKSLAALLFIPLAFGIHQFIGGWGFIVSLIAACTIVYYFSQRFLKNSSCQLITETIINTLHKRR